MKLTQRSLSVAKLAEVRWAGQERVVGERPRLKWQRRGGLFEDCLSTKGSAAAATTAASEALNNTYLPSPVENKLSVMALDETSG